MQYFLETVETIDDGVGFSRFGKVHLLWLTICVLSVIVCSLWYRKQSQLGRKRWKACIAVLLIADELFKVAILLAGGNYQWGYLPLHLCSMNAFLIIWHTVKPSELLGSLLYAICIPGAIAALVFPAWTSLPITSGLHIHSFTAHILLVLYPAVLIAAGEIHPSVRQLPLCLLLLVGAAVPIYCLNRLLHTNFMFLMHAEEGNPLYFFEKCWGNHLWGFPIIISGVVVIMYAPVIWYQKRKTAS